MTKENINRLTPGEGTELRCDSQQRKEYLQRLKFLRVLMELLKDEKSQYPLSMVLEHGRECQYGYEEKEILNEIKNFEQDGYIRLNAIQVAGEAGRQADVDILLEEENFEKILVNLKPSAFSVLFDYCIELSEDISRLGARQSEDGEGIKRLEEQWEEYDTAKGKILNIAEEIDKAIKEFGDQKANWEKDLEKSEEQQRTEWETYKIEVLVQAEKKSSDKIEEELKMGGKIGQAMQDMQKDIIQFMVIFITIFAMVGLDVKNAGQWSVTEVLRVNIMICAVMSTLMGLVSIAMAAGKKRTFFMLGLSVVLWIIALLSVCI